MRKLIITLVLATVVLVAGRADAFIMKLGPGGIGSGNGVTGAFDEMGLYAETTSTNTGGGTFSDVGNVAVTSLIPPPVIDNEGLLSYQWSLYGSWTNLAGTVTPGTNPAGNPALFFNYTSGDLNLYASAGVPYNFHTGAAGANDDTGFVGPVGDLVGTLTLNSGKGELDTKFLSGDAVLDWKFVDMKPGFWLDANGNDLSLLATRPRLIVDSNTDLVIINPTTGQTMSVHDGSADVAIPEPGSIALFASGLMGMLGAGFRRKTA
ncbi:MAG: PEP-CTERM sorting domain-containing protein [Candidatus Omnitrophica bacterium]|nr:PEP-CTERM sorting domain-containing protein [Candidatus Omnitrophota bacterium]